MLRLLTHEKKCVPFRPFNIDLLIQIRFFYNLDLCNFFSCTNLSYKKIKFESINQYKRNLLSLKGTHFFSCVNNLNIYSYTVFYFLNEYKMHAFLEIILNVYA